MLAKTLLLGVFSIDEHDSIPANNHLKEYAFELSDFRLAYLVRDSKTTNVSSENFVIILRSKKHAQHYHLGVTILKLR